MIHYSRYVLSNGLRLLHHYDATTQMVALNLRYDVGSRDENSNRTGLAHLFEHLMFGGSENAPNFDQHLQEAGGVSNAWTSSDCTNFYETLPAHNVETAFWLESDRLLQLKLNEQAVEAQKSVVMEEFKQRYLNVPYGDLNHIIMKTAYQVHPYQWPVIGKELSHIADASMDEILGFFNAHYSVDNMALCVSGNVTFEKAIELTEKWFGGIKPRNVVARNLPVEPVQTKAREVRVCRDVPENFMVRLYHMSGENDPDYIPTDMLSDILSNGNSSRFYRNVIMKCDLFNDLDATILGSNDPGLMMVSARLRDGVDFESAKDVIDKELHKLLTEGVTQREIERYANKYNSRELYKNVGYEVVAEKLCKYELLGDANRINTDGEAYYKVTADDINRVAHNVFNPDNCSTVYYGPSVKE